MEKKLFLCLGENSITQIELAIAQNRISVNGINLNAAIEQLIEDWRTMRAEIERLKADV